MDPTGARWRSRNLVAVGQHRRVARLLGGLRRSFTVSPWQKSRGIRAVLGADVVERANVRVRLTVCSDRTLELICPSVPRAS